MSKLDQYSLIDFSKHNIELFLQSFTQKILCEPIMKHPKNFKHKYDGYRANNIPIKKLIDIYYNDINSNINSLLNKYLMLILKNNIENTDIPKLLDSAFDNVFLLGVSLDKLIRQEKLNIYPHLLILLANIECSADVQQLLIEYHDTLSAQLYENENDVKKKYAEKYSMLESKYVDIEKKFSELKNATKNDEKKQKHIISEYENKLNMCETDIDKKNNDIIKLNDEINKLGLIISSNNIQNSKLEKKITELENSIFMLREEKAKQIEDIIIKDNNIAVLHTDFELLRKKLNDTEMKLNEQTQKANQLQEKMSLLQQEKNTYNNSLQNVIPKEFAISFFDYDKENIEIINDKDEFIEILNNNLKISGICSEFSKALSYSVFSAIKAGFGIIVSGHYSRSISDAISYSIEAKKCDIITLPIGYKNISELSYAINNIDSNIIMIENAIDSITETLCISLIKLCPSKIIIFSVNDIDELKLYNRCFLGSLFIIDSDTIFNTYSNEQFYICKTSKEIFIKTKNESNEFKQYLDKTTQFYLKTKLPKTIYIRLSELLFYSIADNKKEQLNVCILLSTLQIISNSYIKDKLIENVNDMQRDFLNNYLQEEDE